jgi:hypothetical protein
VCRSYVNRCILSASSAAEGSCAFLFFCEFNKQQPCFYSSSFFCFIIIIIITISLSLSTPDRVPSVLLQHETQLTRETHVRVVCVCVCVLGEEDAPIELDRWWPMSVVERARSSLWSMLWWLGLVSALASSMSSNSVAVSVSVGMSSVPYSLDMQSSSAAPRPSPSDPHGTHDQNTHEEAAYGWGC